LGRIYKWFCSTRNISIPRKRRTFIILQNSSAKLKFNPIRWWSLSGIGNPLYHGDKYTVLLSSRRNNGASCRVVVTRPFSIGLYPVNFNHNGEVNAINLSQRTEIVREIVHYGTVHARARGPRTIPSCRAIESRTRGSRTWLRRGKCHLRGGRGASTCAPSVGCGSRGLGVITPAKKKERNEAQAVATSIQPTLGGATPGDTHVTPIMTDYYLIPSCKDRARDFRCRTNNELPLIWYRRWQTRRRDFYTDDGEIRNVFQEVQNRYEHYAQITKIIFL